MHTVRARALQRVLEILGSIERAAVYLGMSESILNLLLCESIRTPDRVFLRAVDLITEDDVAALQESTRTTQNAPAAIETDDQSSTSRGRGATATVDADDDLAKHALVIPASSRPLPPSN